MILDVTNEALTTEFWKIDLMPCNIYDADFKLIDERIVYANTLTGEVRFQITWKGKLVLAENEGEWITETRTYKAPLLLQPLRSEDMVTNSGPFPPISKEQYEKELAEEMIQVIHVTIPRTLNKENSEHERSIPLSCGQ
jgi:hypothetical protein